MRAEIAAQLAAADAALRAGELVIYPTETFYGIAADPRSPAAMAKLFAVKGRAPDQPIALIAADTTSAFALAREVPPLARRLAAAFWPGPLTLVLPARPDLHDAVRGPDGVGVRVSSHPIARDLAAAFGAPITATSANLSGAPALTRAADVVTRFPAIIKVLLEDELRGGAPSTVVAVTENACRMIREGAVPASAIAATVAGAQLAERDR